MNSIKTTFLVLCFLFSGKTFAQEIISKKIYTTTGIDESKAPKIDGLIDDQSWQKVEWNGDYVEWSPEENTQPTEQTFLKILYDEKNLYVAFKCLDKDPNGVVRRLSRRDGFDGDWVEINLDSNHDLTTAFSFTITAAGVKGEEFISSNGMNWDPTWNPIWYAATNVNEEGWTAEIRIPLSQIRFGKADEQVWGIQSTRRYFRNEERSVWQRSPQNSAGWVSDFGELHGLENLTPQKQIEIQPYGVTSFENYKAEPGNPFKDGNDISLNAGLDGKIGITSDLKLDFTINPDFGQVEADPSAIALDGFQIFFPEQRPFFIESKNIFDYQFSTSRSGNTFGSDNLFYSRRIGRAPQGYPSPSGIEDVIEYVEIPSTTTILGSTKLSGKTANGWSIGILESMTAQENATISDQGSERKEAVEPFTNYFVSRVQKDFNNRNSYVGGIFTSTNRNLTDDLDFLHQSAYTVGIDSKHQWKNRTWYVEGNLVLSQVSGSENAITSTQQSITHLFQRVDASHLEVDTAKTSLTGTGGNLKFGKASGNLRFETGGTWRSPELELNDLGFQRQSDDIRHFAWVGYRTTKPLKRVRQYSVNLNQITALDFEGNLNQLMWYSNGFINLKNNWWVNGGLNFKPVQYSNYALRGGPRLNLGKEVGYYNGWISDSRKKVRLNFNNSGTWGLEGAYRYLSVSGAITYQPTNAVQVSFQPTYNINNDKLQYVVTQNINGSARYINGEIDQATLSFPLRVDYIFKPNLSLQYWGQPYISRGRYKNFNYITSPTADSFNNRFEEYQQNQIQLQGEEYLIDENLDGTTDYSFSQPDFAFVQFRSNLVLRWEYTPGSELFLVWSQDVTQFGDFNEGLIEGLENNILNQKPLNIFLVKLTYRFVK